MGNTLSRDGQNYRWDSLFQALTRPDDLRDYLERMGPSHGPLRTQIDLLTGTLQVDLSLLKVSEVAESFDTATLELRFGAYLGPGGWGCGCASSSNSSQRKVEEPPGVPWGRGRGCNCGCPALSATCWLERLLSKPDALLEEKVGSWPALWPLVTALLDVVCRRDGNPFALTRLLRVPKVFSSLMKHDEQTAQTALDFLTFGQRAKTLGTNRGVMDENVITALALNKAKTLGVVEPLYGSGLAICHGNFPFDDRFT